MSDLRVGGAYRLSAEHPDAGHLEITGRYIEVRPPELLRYSWRWAGAPDDEETLVSIFLAAATASADETDLIVVHEGFPDQASRDDHLEGWNDCLDRLARMAASRHASEPDRNDSTISS
jgi:glutathione S-transferase